jgi:hypothetical protein
MMDDLWVGQFRFLPNGRLDRVDWGDPVRPNDSRTTPLDWIDAGDGRATVGAAVYPGPWEAQRS